MERAPELLQMKPTPAFLDPFICQQFPIEAGQNETDWRETNWHEGKNESFIVLSFVSSWIFAPRPQDTSRGWEFRHRLQINDWTSGRAHVFQQISVNFVCPGDTAYAELPQYLQGRR